MKTKNFTLYALGLAAAFSLVSAGTASAQARSETRIPVRKDAPAEAMARTDTVRLPGRVDTVTIRGRVDTVVRTVDRMMKPDTVMMMMAYQPMSKLYFGFGGGYTVPTNNYRNSTKDGGMGQVQVGYFPGGGWLGARLDGEFSYLFARDAGCAPTRTQCPNTKVYQGTGNLIARYALDRRSKLNPVVYALAGGGVTKFQDFLAYQRTKSGGGTSVVTAGDDSYVPFTAGPPPADVVVGGASAAVTAANRGTGSIWGHADFGGGVEFNIMRAHMFAEAKYNIITTNGGNSHIAPALVGFNFGW